MLIVVIAAVVGGIVAIACCACVACRLARRRAAKAASQAAENGSQAEEQAEVVVGRVVGEGSGFPAVVGEPVSSATEVKGKEAPGGSASGGPTATTASENETNGNRIDEV